MLAVDVVADALADFDPPHAAAYRDNARRYVERLRKLDAYARTVLATIPEAHRVLVELLEANPNMVTAQLEAARNLKRWAGGRDVTRLQESLLGAERRGARGDPIVWGWGRLGVTLQRAMATRTELADAFFEARYELAEGRLQLAQAQPEQRERLARQALEDVRQTWLTYPQLGGESRRGAFDALTRRIQGTLGQPPRGLAAFERAG